MAPVRINVPLGRPWDSNTISFYEQLGFKKGRTTLDSLTVSKHDLEIEFTVAPCNSIIPQIFINVEEDCLFYFDDQDQNVSSIY